jgi:hypothetical protein
MVKESSDRSSFSLEIIISHLFFCFEMHENGTEKKDEKRERRQRESIVPIHYKNVYFRRCVSSQHRERAAPVLYQSDRVTDTNVTDLFQMIC